MVVRLTFCLFFCCSFFFYLKICLCLSFLSLFWFFLAIFFWVVLDSRVGLVIVLACFSLAYCFLLKKLTLNTLKTESIKFWLYPAFVVALSLILSSFWFSLYLTYKGNYLSSCCDYLIKVYLTYFFAFCECALAN